MLDEQWAEQMDFEALQEARRQIGLQLGEETKVLDEVVERQGEYVLYLRRSEFAKFDKPVDGRWLFRDGKVAGLEFKPAKTATP